MPYFKWNNEYSVMIHEMDEEHEVLMQLMDNLYQLYKQKESRYKISNALNELIKFTQIHFDSEEEMLANFQYDGLMHHRLMHNKLLLELHRYQEEFEEEQHDLDSNFFEFLRFWLLRHIKGKDLKYGLQFRDQDKKSLMSKNKTKKSAKKKIA